MARIPLFDRDDRESHTGTPFVLPDPADFRNARESQRFPDRGTAGDGLEHHCLVHGTMLGRIAEDRAVPVHDRFDTDSWTVDRLAAIIPCPFSEGTLFQSVILGRLS